MPDREKVIKGLQAHSDGCGYRSHYCDTMDCPYRYGDESCDIEEMCRDALALLKEQEEQMISWTKQIARMQQVHAPAGWQSEDQRMYNKGVWDGLQIAWNIISEGR